MIAAQFSRVFAAAHRVWNDPGKCSNVHGHNYRVEAVISASDLTPQNFVLPFDAIKDVVDAFDHTLIIDTADPLADAFYALPIKVILVSGVPSTEFLAQAIADAIAARGREEYAGRWGQSLHLSFDVTVSLRETDGIMATATASS